MNNIAQLLRDEIQSRTAHLSKMEIGTEEYDKTVNSIGKLVDRVIELEKLEYEHEDKGMDRDIDRDLKREQMNEDRKDRLIRNIIAAAGVIVPVGVTIWGTLKSFEFEKEGTITTIMGRGFINKLLPKK